MRIILAHEPVNLECQPHQTRLKMKSIEDSGVTDMMTMFEVAKKKHFLIRPQANQYQVALDFWRPH
jgi:hypothetical protein